MDILIVVDMQNDFVYGSLKNDEAIKIVPNVKKYIDNFSGEVLYTKDTHYENYLDTNEGKHLPIKHCILGTVGHNIIKELDPKNAKIFQKETFGSVELACYLEYVNSKNKINNVVLIGVCTDICVLANAVVIKTHLPEINVIVESSCCAGITKKSHKAALCAMKSLQIEVR